MSSSFPMLSTYSPNYSARDQDEVRRTSTISDARSEAEDPLTVRPPPPPTPGTTQPRKESKSHRKLVFTDPVAFRYLEEDDSTIVLAKRHRLEGYEVYVVEQWIVSRTHPTFTICTYTGDPNHAILVNVLAVPDDQSTWSPRLKVYFNAVSQTYTRERETHLGVLLVANLSAFPSALNIISVPDGDIKKHREDFIVNEDLKRMGCAGRAAMSLQYPQASTINKFHFMYRTFEKLPLYSAVMELVRYCQIALVLFGKLDSPYADGLLCDVTEQAISEWWNEIGTDFHNVEPSDGILGPTTVAGLIGLMVGAYNRLKETGAPVGKDPLDVSSMKRAIVHFQKANKMDRTRRLDRATLDRLHRVTANKVDDEGLGVTRALKSTVAGFTGKGGEMIARGFGGGKEKVGIAEVETLDIERLAQLVTGKSMKWLWQGKDKGSSSAGIPPPGDELNARVFSTDDQGNFIWTSGLRDGADDLDTVNGTDQEGREGRTGRIREVVGLNNARTPGSRHHTDDEGPKPDHLAVPSAVKELRKPPPLSQRSSQSSTHEFPALTLELAQASAQSSVPNNRPDRAKTLERKTGGTRDRSGTNLSTHRHAVRGGDHREQESPAQKRMREHLEGVRDKLKDRRYQNFSATFKFDQPQAKALRRSLSAIQLRNIQEGRQAKLPRHLSFSIVSDAIEAQKLKDDSSDSDDNDSKVGKKSIPALMKIRKDQLRQSQDLGVKVFALDRGVAPFAESRIQRVEYMKQEAQGQLEELNSVYYQQLEEYQTFQATSTDLVAREKTLLNEAVKSIDMLGQKLDYEVELLQSRMQEVEEGVDEFERRVLDIEASVQELIAKEEKPQQTSWYHRWFGIGRGLRTEEQEAEVQANVAELRRSVDALKPRLSL